MGWVSVESMDVIHDGSLVPAYACVFATRQFFDDDNDLIPQGDPSKMHGGYYRRVAVTQSGNVSTIAPFGGANYLASTYDVPSGHNVSEYILGLYTSSGKLVRILFQGIQVPDTPNSTSWEGLHLFSNAVHQPMRRDYYDRYQINELIENALLTSVWGNNVDGGSASTIFSPIMVADGGGA